MKIRLPTDRARSGKNEQSNKGMQQSKRRVEDAPNTRRVIDVRFAADPQCSADIYLDTRRMIFSPSC
jgi:hypothetical protein